MANGAQARAVADAPEENSTLCLEALGIILAHELVRPEAASHRTEPRARGGLAAGKTHRGRFHRRASDRKYLSRQAGPAH